MIITSFRRRRQINFFIVVLQVFAVTAGAQKETPVQEFERISGKYPNNSIVCLFREEKSVIEYYQGKLRIVTQISRENMFLDENGSLYNTARVPSSDFFEATGIDVRSLVPAGSKYKTIKGKSIQKTDNHLQGDVFHDDLIFYDVTFPDASKGSKSFLGYKEITKEPHFFGSFFFDAPGMPTERSRLEVIMPDGIELAWVYFNLDTSKIKYSRAVIKGGKIMHSWEMTDIPETKRERGGPGYKHLSPHIVTYIKSVTLNGEKKNFLSDYTDLHRYYTGFIKEVNREGSASIDSMALALTADAKTDAEKVRNVFYWVQDNIKYIAFEDGLGGFVPRNARDIFEKRYGDCKDMTSIMHYMLAKAGVSTYMTWIGTRDLPYSYLQLPTPYNDNHMILSWKDGEQWYFIDGTSNFNEFGYPSSFIQGKEALVHIDLDRCKVVNVPVVEYSKNIVSDTVVLTMDGSRLNGKGTTIIDGYYKQSVNRNINSLTRDDTHKYMSAFLQKGSNKFMLDSILINNKGVREKPLVVDYKFNIRDYIYIHENEAYVNLHLDKDYLDDYIDSKRQAPYDRNFHFQHNWHYRLIVPDGYVADRIPENISFNHDLFSFRLSYRKSGNNVYCDFKIISSFMSLSKDYFAEWNAMIGVLNSAFKQTIVLKKTTNK